MGREIKCECLSCGSTFEADEDTLRAGKKVVCPNCGFEHCRPEGEKRDAGGDWRGPIPLHKRRPEDANGFWPRH